MKSSSEYSAPYQGSVPVCRKVVGGNLRHLRADAIVRAVHIRRAPSAADASRAHLHLCIVEAHTEFAPHTQIGRRPAAREGAQHLDQQLLVRCEMRDDVLRVDQTPQTPPVSHAASGRPSIVCRMVPIPPRASLRPCTPELFTTPGRRGWVRGEALESVSRRIGSRYASLNNAEPNRSGGGSQCRLGLGYVIRVPGGPNDDVSAVGCVY